MKDGLIIIAAYPVEMAQGSQYNPDEFVFADVNGDDWFYFEDTTTSDSVESCAKPHSRAGKSTASTISVRTISGSDTTLINFAYNTTPKHKVLHEGHCNFAGIKPVSPSQRDVDAGALRVQSL